MVIQKEDCWGAKGECQKWEEIITMQYQQIKYDKYNSRNALTAGGWKNLGLWGHHKCK